MVKSMGARVKWVRGLLGSALCFWASAGPVAAQGAVEFGAVDAGTVRVFAVQNVSIEEVQTRRGTRVVALPNMGHGTGFSVPGNDRLLLTAAHVVTDALYVVVRLPGEGAYFPARVAYRDDERDVAVLVIEGDVPPLSLQPPAHALRTRQPVFTVGYPLDASRRQAQSSRGIVGGVREDGQVQLDMDVNPGNSGGPVIDDTDHVVGMVVARGDVENGVQGLALAVPLATLHDALSQARDRIRHGRAPTLPSDAARAAQVIDTLSRVGLMRVLREASDVTEGTADTQTIEVVRALNTPGLSPDLQVFVAAFLWDAAQMLMYRAGDHVSPSSMPAGPTRTLAEELLSEASVLLRAAAAADPTVVDRSPFVRVTTGGATVLVSSEALRPFVEAFPVAAATPLPAVPPERWEWRTRRTWALLAGVGLGAAGFLGGQDDAAASSGWGALRPGAGLRFFAGLRLAPVSALTLVVELDLLLIAGAQLGGESTPPSEPSGFFPPGSFGADANTPTMGGAGTFLMRFYPRGQKFFFGAGARIGAQRFSGSVNVGFGGAPDFRDLTGRFVVIQPGAEVGFELQLVDIGVRFHVGIPESNTRAGFYTLMLNLGVRLAGGDL